MVLTLYGPARFAVYDVATIRPVMDGRSRDLGFNQLGTSAITDTRHGRITAPDDKPDKTHDAIAVLPHSKFRLRLINGSIPFTEAVDFLLLRVSQRNVFNQSNMFVNSAKYGNF